MATELASEQLLVSVLMPVYNAEQYIEAALTSVLNQSYQNLEVLVFNDGSSDSSIDILRRLASQDKRIVVHDSSVNYGYVRHLNEGLATARGKYIARMDADDIAWPERIARQVAHLEAYPEIGACGTWFDIVGRPEVVEKMAATPLAVRMAMLANSPMAHPTVMMRAALIRAHNLCYDVSYMPAEDYQLWYRLSKVGELTNIPEVLLSYRQHAGQISSRKMQQQRSCADRTRLEQLTEAGFTLTSMEQAIYCQLVDNSLLELTPAEYGRMKPVMDKLVTQNRAIKAFPEAEFEAFIHQRWKATVYYIKQFSPKLFWQLFGTSTRVANDSLGANVLLRTALKSILRWKMRV